MFDSYKQSIRAAGVYDPNAGEMDGTVVEFEGGEVLAVRDDMPGKGNQLAQMRADLSEQAVRATRNLRRDLDSGVTTMRLMAAERYVDVTFARLEREGELDPVRAARVNDRTDTFERGKSADVVAADDLRENLETLASPTAVFKRGIHQ